MAFGIAFWIIMLLWLVLGLMWHGGYATGWGPWGFSLMLFIMLGLLGWKVFGPPLHG